MMTTFNRQSYESRAQTPSTEFAALPEGSYRATVTGGTVGVHDAGDTFWELEFTVRDHPEYAGRKIWRKYRLNHADARQAQWDKNRFGQVYEALNYHHEVTHPEQMRSSLVVEIVLDQWTNNKGKIANSVKYVNAAMPNPAATAGAVAAIASEFPGATVECSTPVAPAPDAQEIPW